MSKDLIEFFENQMDKEVIKYAVQKQMFCPKTGAILDYRTAISFEVYIDKHLIANKVMSPTLVDHLQTMKDGVLKQVPAGTVVFKTLNKKLKNDLLVIVSESY